MHGVLPRLQRMTVKLATEIAGTLSFPSKMPGTSYSIPAEACITGSKLAKVPGSVCASCYALKGHGSYKRGNTQKALYRRLRGIQSPLWVVAMTKLLRHTHSKPRIKIDLGSTGILAGQRFRWNETGFHRWFDSGDLQSVEHFSRICEVARRTPKIRHWLPTQELGMVEAHLERGGTIPPNLVVRISGVMVDNFSRRAWPTTSSVFKDLIPENSHICPAPLQEHQCKSCRACWSHDVAHVAYELH